MNRRMFVSLVGASLVNPLAVAVNAAPSAKANHSNREYWVSAQGKNTYGMAWFESNSKVANKVNTGFRGHQVIAVSHSRIVMVARRPGQQLAVADLKTGALVAQTRCPGDRVLAGHACLSADGHRLFTAEADERDGRGYVGIYDLADLRRLGEFSSHGIGPHQLEFMPDAHTLVVANGGIHTRAATGRKVLNLDTMDSSLVYIDTGNGALLASQKLHEPKAGLRHLAVSDNGTVVVAAQLQRGAMSHSNTIALGALHKPGEALQPLHAPETLWAAMRDYAGSVVINSAYNMAGITSPRGDIAAFFSLQTGEYVGHHAFHDVCGIATTTDKSAFVLSNSQGQLRVLSAASLEEVTEQRQTIPNWHWDNHLAVVQG